MEALKHQYSHCLLPGTGFYVGLVTIGAMVMSNLVAHSLSNRIALQTSDGDALLDYSLQVQQVIWRSFYPKKILVEKNGING
jgi:hypothetical protein